MSVVEGEHHAVEVGCELDGIGVFAELPFSDTGTKDLRDSVVQVTVILRELIAHWPNLFVQFGGRFHEQAASWLASPAAFEPPLEQFAHPQLASLGGEGGANHHVDELLAGLGENVELQCFLGFEVGEQPAFGQPGGGGEGADGEPADANTVGGLHSVVEDRLAGSLALAHCDENSTIVRLMERVLSTTVDFSWPPAAATGIGSLPYDDLDEAARVVAGELPDFIHVPELPSRGAGADMIGRTAAMLVDIHVDLQPSGWRVVDRPGADEGRARSMLNADLDALEIAAYGYSGPLKVQLAGPLTLATGLERSRGDRMLADYRARLDLAESLAEGAADHVADVARRVPGASIVVQVDEPGLPTVLAGDVPTISGFGRLRAVSDHEAETLLTMIVAAVASPVVVHCCAANAPVGTIRAAGATAVSLDVATLDHAVLEQLAAAVDDGLAVWPGIVPAMASATKPSDRDLAEQAAALWRRLDQDPAAMAERTVITPSCGLAGADPAWVKQAYASARSGARAFSDLVESAN